MSARVYTSEMRRQIVVQVVAAMHRVLLQCGFDTCSEQTIQMIVAAYRKQYGHQGTLPSGPRITDSAVQEQIPTPQHVVPPPPAPRLAKPLPKNVVPIRK